MMRTITKTNSFLGRHSQSIRWIAVTGLALLLGNYSEGQVRKMSARKDSTMTGIDTLTPVPVLFGTQQAKYITGAVSYLSGSAVNNKPGTNRLNSLSGEMAGLAIISRSGLPSTEDNTILIRGQHDFSGSAPMILINGKLDDYSEIEPNDIESITVLKDAASTAMYGLTAVNTLAGSGSAINGVILITTKRGHNGKLRVSYNEETTLEQPTRLPKFADAYHYALLYNEAQLNDNPLATPLYPAAELQAYQTGSDPFKYANVNWENELLKKNALQIRNNVNIMGGGDKIRYYFSGSYLNDNGIFKTDPTVNSYSTNSNLNVFNLRGNLDVDLSKNLTFSADVRSKRETRNAPGAYNTSFDQNLLRVIYTTPNNAYPVKNANGTLGAKPNYTNNPYGLLNLSGYNTLLLTSLSISGGLTYNFNDVVKGLKLKADFSVANLNNFQTSRSKTFSVSYLQNGTYVKSGTDGILNASNGTGSFTARQRYYDHSASLTYDRDFGNNSFSALLMYQFQQAEDDATTQLTRNFLGPKGRLSYRYKNRYLFDVSASYQATEQNPLSQRYAFFPAASAGWIISDESFAKGGVFNFLKLRGSYGKVGAPSYSTYYGFLDNYGTVVGGALGTNGANSTGLGQIQVGNPLTTWETSLKGNIGLDMAFLGNRLNASIDVFKERTSHINVGDAISAMYGAPISSPIGVLDNKGFEIAAGWNDHIGQLEYSISGNLSVAKNKIINEDEPARNYPWMYYTGQQYGVRMGYVFDRYFTEGDITSGNYPDQSQLGVQRAGDLKYKDLNGDGRIDFNDMAPIGSSNLPEVNYGLNLGFKYHGFDLSVLFQGTSHSTTYNSGATYWEFYDSGKDNVSQHIADTRWTPGSGQSAGYPRLTLSNTNNFVTSSYWLQNNSYVRLKYTELGYTIPGNFLKRIGASSTRIFVNGYNLLVWSKVKDKDPEASDNSFLYPLQRSFSIGLNVKF